jgi:ubiquinone/menaquinone biosynthesis C-methylase UbiE
MKRIYPHHYDIGTGLYAKLAEQPYWEESIRDLIKFVSPFAGKSILDAGCGHGISTRMLAEAFPSAHITGVDISKNMVRRANRLAEKGNLNRQQINFQQADATHLPINDNTFDLVAGHSFLYMVRSKEAVINECYRVLKPGGTLAFLEPGTSIDAVGRSAVIKDNFRNPKPRTRLRTKLLLFRIYTTRKGTVTPREMEIIFTRAGFSDFTWKEGAGGRGLMLKAVKK